jgi:hypothetical protein
VKPNWQTPVDRAEEDEGTDATSLLGFSRRQGIDQFLIPVT